MVALAQDELGMRDVQIVAQLRPRRAPGEFDCVDKLSVEELRALAKGELDITSYRPDDAGNSRHH